MEPYTLLSYLFVPKHMVIKIFPVEHYAYGTV